jgi:hypothetical protein
MTIRVKKYVHPMADMPAAGMVNAQIFLLKEKIKNLYGKILVNTNKYNS